MRSCTGRMAMVERIACFLTCGYTEAGVMQAFLKRINSKYEYKQYLPNKTIKKKGQPKKINDEISGLSGEALLKKIYEILEKNRDDISKCKAILIEDDLDGRFYGKNEDEIEEYKQSIIAKVHGKLKKELPVYFLFASPEIESWFIADWKNGFEFLYTESGIVKDLEQNIRLFFVHHLKYFINKNVLGEYCNNIENYGWFDSGYVKLSDQIIDAIQIKVKEYINTLSNINLDYAKRIYESRDLYYSKKIHGYVMLNNIDPQIVAENCKVYFACFYRELLTNV